MSKNNLSHARFLEFCQHGWHADAFGNAKNVTVATQGTALIVSFCVFLSQLGMSRAAAALQLTLFSDSIEQK
jgi:hypothetical protein